MTGQRDELIKISTLQERYKLDSRQAVYDRINGLGIEPVARGKISPRQLELLDRLDLHVRSNGAIADFPRQPEVQLPTLDKLDKLDNSLEISKNDALATIEGFTKLVETLVRTTQPPQSPLTIYEELEKAVKCKWVLPTSKVKELIEVSPKTAKGEQTFKRGSFTFTKAGKIGNETGWRVTRS